MPRTAQLKSNFSKGELSPQIEGRPDLAAFFNGARQLENYFIQYEGGVFRRYGTRLIGEVKDSASYVRGVPFKFANTVSYFIEMGHGYFRFYRRGFNGSNLFQPIRISAGAPIFELATPYANTEFADMQWTQSADVLYIAHPDHQQRKLNRVSDTEWSLSVFIGKPPPSYEADADITDNFGIPSSGVEIPPGDGGDTGDSGQDNSSDAGDGGGDDGGGGDGDGDGDDDGA